MGNMKILIAYYSKTGVTKRVAEALAAFLEARQHAVRLEHVKPEQDLKAYEYSKNEKDLKLKNPLVDLRGFDMVFVGTPVWNFSPTPIIVSYLRQLRSARNRKFALFATCTVLPGPTVQRMGSILSTKGARVADSITVRSGFEIDKSKLLQIEAFAERLLPAQKPAEQA